MQSPASSSLLLPSPLALWFCKQELRQATAACRQEHAQQSGATSSRSLSCPVMMFVRLREPLHDMFFTSLRGRAALLLTDLFS